jgi:sodium transport system ATP-binding protein
LLQVNSLSKTFSLSRKEQKLRKIKRLDAVSDVSFHCAAGSITGMLGTNGAGKTTTLRMLSTAFQASGGNIEFEGTDIYQNISQYRSQIGFISGDTKLYRRLTVAENLRYFGRLYGMNKTELESSIEQLSQRLQLSEFLHRKADDLSTGMYQRANLARALVHNPKLLILDEPTTGLDIAAAEIVLDVMKEEQQRGKTVIFSTHHMHEVSRLCDQIVVINKGKNAFTGSIPEFLEQTTQPSLDLALLSVVKT